MVNTSFVNWMVQRRVSNKLYNRYLIRPIELQCLIVASTYLMLKGKKSAKIELFVKFYSGSQRKRYFENRINYYHALAERGFMDRWHYKRTKGYSYSISEHGFRVLNDVEVMTEAIYHYYRDNMELYSLKELQDKTELLLTMPNLFELSNYKA